MTIPRPLHQIIHTFCSDMWDGYLGAIADFLAAHPEVKAKIVIDRFHVAKNYRDDFDALRNDTRSHLQGNRYRHPLVATSQPYQP
jgi:hypothetical protein